jgi:ssDNA-binding protein
MTTIATTTVKLNRVRLTFPKLFPGQEETFGGKGDPYWSASFLLPRDHPDLPKLREAIKAAAVAKWPQKFESQLKAAQAKDKLPVHDGDLKADKPYGASYKGMLYVSARNNAKSGPAPSVFDKVVDPATGMAREIKSAADKRAPYSGCYVNVILNTFGYQNEGEGVAASIMGVQFEDDGERLAGGVQAQAKDFEAIPDKTADKAAEGAGAAAFF